MLARKYRATKLIKNVVRLHYTNVTPVKPHSGENPSPLARQIAAKIRLTGPITVADYMREVLTAPLHGYYMHRDVFGRDGDFVTSPELGQMFGEMVAIWLLNEWSKIGAPKPFQIVELGPGRGTLVHDLLHVFGQFDALPPNTANTVHLVEISPALADLQAARLCAESGDVSAESYYKAGVSHAGVPVRWYRHLSDVPRGQFTLLVAHEFFDALPVHKFQRTERGYREVLIDLADGTPPPNHEQPSFRYVLARESTPVSKILIDPNESREHVEISPQSIVLAKQVAERLETDGGLALIADYGHENADKDTFRAFRKHKLHDPLIEPGTADLTADVDFLQLKRAATENGGVLTFGPVTQRHFLLQMGIEYRFKALEQSASAEQLAGLRYGYRMMIDENEMGSRFKFLALVPAVLDKFLRKFPVVGFQKNVDVQQ